MKIMMTCTLAAALSIALVASAFAFPPYAYGDGGPYGYRPGPFYGAYGYRHYYPFRRGLSYGTGYHGRGTATGGPAGGLPNRN